MTPAVLGRALAACLGLGAVDVVALNLLARPAQSAPARAVRPAQQAVALVSLAPARPSTHATRSPSSQLEPARQAAPPVVVLEFEPAAHWLDGRALHALKASLQQLLSARHITVVGHADLLGPEDLNERLSAARAWAVARRLAHAGMEPTRMHVTSSGAREPRLDGVSRRVEIYIELTP